MTPENQKLIELKTDEHHFIEQVIRNMKYLEHMYMQGPLRNDKDLFGIQNSIQQWLYRASRVEKFLHDNNCGVDKELEQWRTFDQS